MTLREWLKIAFVVIALATAANIAILCFAGFYVFTAVASVAGVAALAFAGFVLYDTREQA